MNVLKITFPVTNILSLPLYLGKGLIRPLRVPSTSNQRVGRVIGQHFLLPPLRWTHLSPDLSLFHPFLSFRAFPSFVYISSLSVRPRDHGGGGACLDSLSRFPLARQLWPSKKTATCTLNPLRLHDDVSCIQRLI